MSWAEARTFTAIAAKSRIAIAGKQMEAMARTGAAHLATVPTTVATLAAAWSMQWNQPLQPLLAAGLGAGVAAALSTAWGVAVAIECPSLVTRSGPTAT